MQLMQAYREHPETLARELPHRDPELLRQVSRGLAVVTWRAIAGDVCCPQGDDDELFEAVKCEIARRI
jgi:hypothetical protein